MIKHDVVAALGQDALVQPTRVREALRANDRLKLALTVLQAAVDQALRPGAASPDLGPEIAAAGIHGAQDAAWWRDLPSQARPVDDGVELPGLDRLYGHLAEDLRILARPVLDAPSPDRDLAPRIARWGERLAALPHPRIDAPTLADLTRGRPQGGDSLHQLVMDLHQALNRLAAGFAGEDVAGAHAWGLAADGSDRPRVAAFMRGVARTRHRKGDHPGLDTSATRDGARLLIQNDIGTNDAHVLVIHVEGTDVALTYSDLHRARFDFFRALMAEAGATWSDARACRTPGLNEGDAYRVGTARWTLDDAAAVDAVLEAVGSRLVFLIDWNRARKRLLPFVGKAEAVAVLHEAARRDRGHRAWLEAGGERLVWNAMAAQPDAFRLGDRLDDVLGPDEARDVLVRLLVLAADAVDRHQPVAWVADEAAVTLRRAVRGRGAAAVALQEHAAWCHALAQGLRDGLAAGAPGDAATAAALAARAKAWERQADEVVDRFREHAPRRPGASADLHLLGAADDVADALEEACFLLGVAAESRPAGWGPRTTAAMQALADAVLGAVQEHVKATVICADPGPGADTDEALDALWRVVQAERACDDLYRDVRRALAREADDARTAATVGEIAAAVETASDHLLDLGHALRHRLLESRGGRA